VESSRGPLARRLRFSLASLLPLILHSFALSLGLRVASFGDASPGPVVCDEVVAAGLLLCTAMEIFFLLSRGPARSSPGSYVVSVLVVVRAFLVLAGAWIWSARPCFLAPRLCLARSYIVVFPRSVGDCAVSGWIW
jgi:hypothetical protein